MMNYEALKTFIALAETRNFTRTAELLYITQPTVTARLRSLEEELGHTLFERTSKHVSLSAAGKHFYPYAVHLLQEITNCTTHMQNYEQTNLLTISAPGTNWDFGPLKESVLDYCARFPKTRFSLLRSVSRVTYERIGNREVDVGLVYTLPSSPGIECINYMEEDLLLVASSALGITSYGGPESGESSLIPMLRPIYADVVSQLMEESLFMYPTTLSSDHPALYLEMVKKGLGVGLVQQSLADEHLKSGELIVLDCEYNQHPMPYKNYLVFRKEREAELQELVDHLLRGAAQFSAGR